MRVVVQALKNEGQRMCSSSREIPLHGLLGRSVNRLFTCYYNKALTGACEPNTERPDLKGD